MEASDDFRIEFKSYEKSIGVISAIVPLTGRVVWFGGIVLLSIGVAVSFGVIGFSLIGIGFTLIGFSVTVIGFWLTGTRIVIRIIIITIPKITGMRIFGFILLIELLL